MKKTDKNGRVKPQKAYVIPHTHWDREWRYPLWKNRILLIEFMEELLETLDTDPAYKCFLLDGQVAPIEDYLEVMPQDRERVTKHIKDGRIAVGPWYSLPDLYPLDGECLVRNLLKGVRVSQQYGDWQKIGYNSFGWGQTAQFPQIYDGFGIDFIVCAKKVSEERAPQSEFIWQGPDGTEVLTSRLGEHARANFYFNAFLYTKYGMNCISDKFKFRPDLSGVAMHNADSEHCDEDFFIIDPKTDYDSSLLKKGVDDAWAATDASVLDDHRLFLNGTDFSTSHPELSDMLKDLNKIYEDREFVNCRLEEYAAVLHENVNKDGLKVIEGELRDGPSCDCSGNALATRIYLKILNKKAQNILLHKTEPLAAMLSAYGVKYPKGMLDVAWKYMLQSHPHDSINGVTQDKTADDVENRLQQAIEIGRVTYDKMVAETLKMVDLSSYDKEDMVVVLFNPLPYTVNTIVKTCICTPASANIWDFTAVDSNGNELKVQDVARDEKSFPIHDLQARPWPYLADRHICYLETGDVPACGYKVIKLVPGKNFNRNHFYWLHMRQSMGEDISRTDNVLENEYLRVDVNSNGTLKLTEKESGRVYDNLNYFEDTGDVGNYWAYYPPYKNKTVNTLAANAKIWTEDNGPLSATIAIEYDMEVPAYGTEAAGGVKGDCKRSDETVVMKITSRVTLNKGAKRVDIKTTVDNTAKNHRLRVAFPTGIKATNACASGHFTVDQRPIKPVKDKDGKYWPEMQTLPMQHFVDISDGDKGIALLNNCLTEYEVKDDENSTAYLTLFRAMGNMIVTWWEAVGVFPKQSGSQLQGPMEFEYSIYPHDGAWDEGLVYTQAETFNAPVALYQVTPHSKGTLPEEHSFVSIEPANLIMSALKQGEDSESIILRLFNPTGNTIEGKVIMPKPAKKAYVVDLNEDRQLELLLGSDPGVLEMSVKQNKIVTIEVIF
ncbi:MAG: glycosyl hydrolase-related protein [Phycisphaerae bacterium]|nr:glycosyl hydrolase-related protein [Phycisphaerae bacterium]